MGDSNDDRESEVEEAATGEDSSSDEEGGQDDTDSGEDDPIENMRKILGQLRRVHYGGAKYYGLMKEVKYGPRSLEESGEMPKLLQQAVFTDECIPGGGLRQERCWALLENGAAMHHDFQGRGSYEQAASLLFADFEESGFPEGNLICFRGSEKCAKVRKLTMGGSLAPIHMYKKNEDIHVNPTVMEGDFKKVVDRHTPKLKEEEVRRLTIDEIDKLHKDGNSAIERYVDVHRDKIYPIGQKSEGCSMFSLLCIEVYHLFIQSICVFQFGVAFLADS